MKRGFFAPFFVPFAPKMKLPFFLLLALFYVALDCPAQVQMVGVNYDTLTIDYRTGGGIDSIDQIVQNSVSLLPGGGFIKPFGLSRFDFLYQHQNGIRFFDLKPYKSMRFSGLPHLGFSYVFGTAGLQQSLLNYQHAFKKGMLINLDVVRYQSNGLLRNGSFLHNDVQLQVEKKGNRYRYRLQSQYLSSNADQSNGLFNSSEALDFDLSFLSVNKANAETRTRRGEGSFTQFVDLLADSSKAFYLFTHHGLQIKNWKYQESSDTLSSIYSLIQFDSTETKDQFQWSSVSNGTGAALPLKNGNVQLGVYADYWNVQNLGTLRDTMEVNTRIGYDYIFPWLVIKGHSSLNIIGAGGEHRHDLALNCPFQWFKLQGNVHYSSLWPDEFVRFGQGNHYQMNLFDPLKQQTLLAVASLMSSLKGIDVHFRFSSGTYTGHYMYDGQQWRNDLVSRYSMQTIELQASKRWKGLTVAPRYLFSIPDKQMQLVPVHQVFTRFSLQGGIFKAKKLQAIVGMDFSWISSYERIGFVPVVSAFDFTSTVSYSGYTNIHLFGAIQIDEFKFFTRVENLGVFWTDRSLPLYLGYPIVPLQINVGITWDFFN